MTSTVQRHRHHHAAVRRTSAAAPVAPAATVGRRRRWFAGGAPTVQTVKVDAGDTLWAIAERHHGDVPIQRYVDRLVELNGGTTAIAAGQLVRLP